MADNDQIFLIESQRVNLLKPGVRIQEVAVTPLNGKTLAVETRWAAKAAKDSRY